MQKGDNSGCCTTENGIKQMSQSIDAEPASNNKMWKSGSLYLISVALCSRRTDKTELKIGMIAAASSSSQSSMSSRS